MNLDGVTAVQVEAAARSGVVWFVFFEYLTIGILAHRRSEDELSGWSPSPKRNARYLGSMKPFSSIGSLGLSTEN